MSKIIPKDRMRVIMHTLVAGNGHWMPVGDKKIKDSTEYRVRTTWEIFLARCTPLPKFCANKNANFAMFSNKLRRGEKQNECKVNVMQSGRARVRFKLAQSHMKIHRFLPMQHFVKHTADPFIWKKHTDSTQTKKWKLRIKLVPLRYKRGNYACDIIV